MKNYLSYSIIALSWVLLFTGLFASCDVLKDERKPTVWLKDVFYCDSIWINGTQNVTLSRIEMFGAGTYNKHASDSLDKLFEYYITTKHCECDSLQKLYYQQHFGL